MESVRKRVQAGPSDLDKFVIEQNIALYRKLLESKDEAHRPAILKLLADEVAKLRKT
ncbi:hypothetical protein KMZ29_21235 [Bradyrhizobium sediminis]|uniref:Uncharacterized protein n=1 Tax=Bradyrhizobium sediminis TaxID=2840469 RepID=A0A975NCY1_9BRAD|nr:hypothetical protein [Bradyrhizobium sediminis]QWG12216.1 hypothetical protein KMZ29_21235 [Bradyrhizobium sediminis]